MPLSVHTLTDNDKSYLDSSCSFNEIFSVVIMFFHSCRNSEDVWVEDDVVRVEVHFRDQ